MPRDYPEYEDESPEETYRDPLKPFLIALVVLLLMFAAIIVLLYMRLQTANTRAETLSQELTAVQVQLDDLRAQRAAETPTPTPTEAPTPTPEPTPEPTPVPEYEGLSVQPTTYYNEGEQPTYTVTDGNNLNMRGGPGTDYDKIGQVPASTGVTALGTNEDGSWVVVNYNGTYGWLKTEFLNG